MFSKAFLALSGDELAAEKVTDNQNVQSSDDGGRVTVNAPNQALVLAPNSKYFNVHITFTI